MASPTCEVSMYFVFVTLKKTDSLQYSINELMVATCNLSTELGCGAFVKVFLATDLRSTGTKVPVKVLSKVICNICLYCYKFIINRKDVGL